MYNGFPNYNPYQPYQYQQPVQGVQNPSDSFQAHQQGNGGLMFVNGLNEASTWVVQPGQRAFLMDRNSNTFYVKSVNENGMPNPIEIYDYKKRDAQTPTEAPQAVDTSDFVTHEELEERLSKLTQKRPQRRTKKEETDAE